MWGSEGYNDTVKNMFSNKPMFTSKYYRILANRSVQILLKIWKTTQTNIVSPSFGSNRPNPHKPMDGYPTPTKFSKINREEIWGWNKSKTKTTTKVLITEDKWFSGGVEERLQRSRKGGWGATDSPWFRPFSATTRFANFCCRTVINLRA